MEREFIQEQNDLRPDKILERKSPFVVVVTKRSTKGILFLILFAIVVPFLIYYLIIDKGAYPSGALETCSVEPTYRISCGRSHNATFEYCTQINCCFDNTAKSCFHYLPSRYYYSNREGFFYKRALEKSPFREALSDQVVFFINELDENSLEIVLQEAPPNTTTQLPSKHYSYKVNQTRLSVEVFRASNQDLLLTTNKGPLIISKNYWEWSFQLTDEYLFGLGETLLNSTLTKVVYANGRDHNTLPIFLACKNHSYHGVVLESEGPLEMTVLPSKLVVVRSLGGKRITIKLHLGPTIPDVMKQKAVGDAVKMKSLGVHLCREGSLGSLSQILSAFSSELATPKSFRYESDCLHENLLPALRNEEKLDTITQMRDLIEEMIRSRDKEFNLALSPHVSVESQTYLNSVPVYLQLNGSDYRGQFLGENVVFPFYQHEAIQQFLDYFSGEVETFFTTLPDFLTLVRNWPSDESFTMEEVADFQYLSESLREAMSGTLPWNATTNSSRHYLDHNEYASLQLLQLKQLFNLPVMTAAHSLETSDPVVLQNVDISWSNFQKAISTILFNSLAGFPLTGVPVCGSTSHFNISHEKLCLRWYLMSVTSPLFRISSDLPKRDPDSLHPTFSTFLADRARWAISFRYQILNYLYQVLESGEPLMRPMFYDFPDDTNTFGLIEQYMVGAALLVAQPTLPDQTQLRIYLPKEVGNWFEFWGGKSYTYNEKTNGYLSLFIVEDDFVAFLREGAVIALADEDVITLKIALKCGSESCLASGVFKTESNSFEIIATETTLELRGNTSDAFYSLHELQIFKAETELAVLRSDIDVKLDGDKNCTIANGTFSC